MCGPSVNISVLENTQHACTTPTPTPTPVVCVCSSSISFLCVWRSSLPSFYYYNFAFGSSAFGSSMTLLQKGHRNVSSLWTETSTDHQVNGKACTHSRDATFSPLEPFLFFNPISCFYDFLRSLLFCCFFFNVMFSNDWTVLEMQWLLNYPDPQLHSGGEASEILPKISCAAHPLIRMKSNWQFWWLTILSLILSPQP